MATVRGFIESKLAGFNIELSADELDVLLVDANVNGTDVYSAATALGAKKAIALAIPELFLKADVTEGGYSVKWDKAGITTYYGMLCDELGLPNKLVKTPSIQDRSNYW
ncbi:hypothetical protein GCM10028806_28500 [Spirosoma terrae]|uniref:Uncharacterized protein n=1 Tax=Spirosoma terrae TaxID=1968276 RepID=A0A6L9L9R4_9BACT|nr:DUF6706 family protein [Spirosoma terrae]NDU97190.1 hypothetical protein [Spirosoma terrae]